MTKEKFTPVPTSNTSVPTVKHKKVVVAKKKITVTQDSRPTKFENPMLAMLPDFKTRLDAIVDQAPVEVSGFGSMTIHESRASNGSAQHLIVPRELFVLDQTTTSGSADIEQDAVGNFFEDWVTEGRDVKELRVWWHSHGRGAKPVPSATDWSTITRSFGRVPWYIMLITNKDRQYTAYLVLTKPFRVKVEIEVGLFVDAAIRDWAKNEVEKHVTTTAGYKYPTGRRWDGRLARFVDVEEPGAKQAQSKQGVLLPKGSPADNEWERWSW